MKKRIISLILAVVMLFSCLSLNIFATDGTGEGGTETAPDHTTDEQKLALIKANTEIGRQGGLKYSWGNGETGGTMNNGSTRLTKKDGHYIVGARTDASATGNEHFIQFSDHSDYGGRDSIQYYAQTPLKGAAFTVSLDVEFTDEFVGKTADGTPNTPNNVSLPLMQTAFYLTTGGGGNGGKSQMGTYMPNLLDITVSGEKITLRALDAGSYRNVTELNVNENYNIAITVDPKDNPGTDKYGSFSVYVNGEMVGHRYGFMHKTHNDQSTFSTENPRAYFIDASYPKIDSNIEFKGGMAYFFLPEGTILPDDTNGDGKIDTTDSYIDANSNNIPDIFDNVAYITAANWTTITGYTCIGTCQGAKDMVLGFVRINQISRQTYYEADAIYIDNIGVYYGEYADLNAHQYIADSHTHDYEAGTTEVVLTCACGLTKAETVAIDANGDRVCDLCVSNAKLGGHGYVLSDHEHNSVNGTNNVTFECAACGKSVSCTLDMGDRDNGIKTPAEVKELAGAANVMASGADGWCGLYYANGGRTEDPIITQYTDPVTGNQYMKYSLTKTTGTGGTYLQVYNSGLTGGAGNALKNFTKWVGKSYVVTVDVMIYENYAFKPFQIDSYTAPNGDKTNTTTNTITFEPLFITASGELQYSEAQSKTYTSTGVTLSRDKFYTLTMHHTPATNSFDVYLDGKCIADGITAISAGEDARTTWENACDNISILDPAYDETAEVVDGVKMFKMEGAKHFSPGFIRLPQITADTVATENRNPDMYAFDNVKFYYSDVNYEIESTESITHCDICDGKVISSGAAITGRSATLGELIDMNVYMTLSERLASTEGAKITLTAGNRTAEYLLTEATKGTDGKYKFSLPLRSSQMADDVVVTLTGDGEAETYTTSIKDYAENLLAASANDSEKDLVKAMLNYGAYSQIYFAGKNGDETLDDKLANAGFDEADKILGEIPLDDEYGIGSFKFTSSGAEENVRFTAMSLVLSSKTYVNLYFKASADATVKIGGNTVNKTDAGDGEYYVSFAVDSPKVAFVMEEITLTDGDTTVTASASAFSAIYAGLSNTDTPDALADLLKAYGWFCNRAGEYTPDYQ